VSVATGRFAVGVESVDRLHEECELRLGELAACMSAGAEATAALAALDEHLQRHFAHEESLMAATRFPPSACHQREHAMVLEVMAEVRRRYGAGERDPAVRLAEALVEWFELHARSMDAALAQWLAATPRDATAA
jgi:hemerythrin-like metal-binding protein